MLVDSMAVVLNALPSALVVVHIVVHIDRIAALLYEGAEMVHIACANFTATRQHHLWTALFDVPFNVTIPFVPYVTPNLIIHIAQQKRNSKTFNKTNSSVRDGVLVYIANLRTDHAE